MDETRCRTWNGRHRYVDGVCIWCDADQGGEKMTKFDDGGAPALRGKEQTMSGNMMIQAYLAEIEQLEDRVEQQENRIEQLEAALYRIRQWAQAYPLEVFPEPDMDLAATALKTFNITLDAVSASNMRHVLKGMIEITTTALKGSKEDE